VAEGIRKLHSKGCPGKKKGGRCRCGGGYEASVYDAGEQKKIRKTFKKRKEAKSWRIDAKKLIDQGALRAMPRDDRILGEALAEHVEGMKTGRIRPKKRERYKPNTIRSYDRALRLHIAGRPIAKKKVTQIRKGDVDRLIEELLEDEKELSARTVSNTLNPIQALYRYEIGKERLAYNPTEGVDLPAGKASRPTRIVNPEEAARLIAALPEEDQALWATAFYAGLRRGELQALRAENIDLAVSEIYVRHGWDQEEGEIDPKSEAGERDVPLLAILRDFLVAHLLRTGRTGEDLVFGRSAREAFYPSTIDNRARKAWEKANEAEEVEAAKEGRTPEPLTPITMHEARHTCVSVMIASGIKNPKAIQEVIGHSKISTTYDVYGHMLPRARDEIRERMDAYLAGEPGEPEQAAA
jgi:integrase